MPCMPSSSPQRPDDGNETLEPRSGDGANEERVRQATGQPWRMQRSATHALTLTSADAGSEAQQHAADRQTNAVQCSAVQCSAVQCSAGQGSAVQGSAAALDARMGLGFGF